MDAGADVEPRRDDVYGLASLGPEDERGAPALVRPDLSPVDAVRGGVDGAEPDGALARQELGRDRRRPRTVRRDAGHAGNVTPQRTEGTSPCAPSAYQTPNATLTAPSAGASRSNEPRTTELPSVRPKPVESSAIENAVKKAKSASAVIASVWFVMDASRSSPIPAVPPIPCRRPIAYAP